MRHRGRALNRRRCCQGRALAFDAVLGRDLRKPARSLFEAKRTYATLRKPFVR